jgi:selenophosphate synthase
MIRHNLFPITERNGAVKDAYVVEEAAAKEGCVHLTMFIGEAVYARAYNVSALKREEQMKCYEFYAHQNDFSQQTSYKPMSALELAQQQDYIGAHREVARLNAAQ